MKQNHLILTLLGAGVLLLGGVMIYQNSKAQPEPTPTPPVVELPETPKQPVEDTQPTTKEGADPRNTTYTIEGQEITLVNGKAEKEAAPGSASKTTVQVFDDSATGDLNGDNLPDNAVMLNVTTGGSGSFFYIAGALQTQDQMYEGTNAVLVGDRIAPQNNNIVNEEIVVNYADRAEGESMETQPSVGMTKYYVYQNDLLSEKSN